MQTFCASVILWAVVLQINAFFLRESLLCKLNCQNGSQNKGAVSKGEWGGTWIDGHRLSKECALFRGEFNMRKGEKGTCDYEVR